MHFFNTLVPLKNMLDKKKVQKEEVHMHVWNNLYKDKKDIIPSISVPIWTSKIKLT